MDRTLNHNRNMDAFMAGCLELFAREMGANFQDCDAVHQVGTSNMLYRAKSLGLIVRRGTCRFSRYFLSNSAADKGWALWVASKPTPLRNPPGAHTKNGQATIRAAERRIARLAKKEADIQRKVDKAAIRANKPQMARRATVINSVFKSQTAYIPPHVKKQICPSGRDTRYLPTGEHREFRKLKIGRYLPFDRTGAPI